MEICLHPDVRAEPSPWASPLSKTEYAAIFLKEKDYSEKKTPSDNPRRLLQNMKTISFISLSTELTPSNRYVTVYQNNYTLFVGSRDLIFFFLLPKDSATHFCFLPNDGIASFLCP